MECPDCKGEGVVFTFDPCTDCDGVGSRTIVDDDGKEAVVFCFTCKGTGKDTDTCDMCGGSGTV